MPESKCKYCDYVAPGLPQLMAHIRWKHKQKSQEEPEIKTAATSEEVKTKAATTSSDIKIDVAKLIQESPVFQDLEQKIQKQNEAIALLGGEFNRLAEILAPLVVAAQQLGQTPPPNPSTGQQTPPPAPIPQSTGQPAAPASQEALPRQPGLIERIIPYVGPTLQALQQLQANPSSGSASLEQLAKLLGVLSDIELNTLKKLIGYQNMMKAAWKGISMEEETGKGPHVE